MTRMYDRPTLGPDGWIVDETPTPNPVYVEAQTDPVTGGIEIQANGQGVLMGNLVSGQWFIPPSVFRLLLNGTGTITLDSKDAAGTITTGVYTKSLTSAVNVIDFPYPGDSTVQIRATLTNTATAEVI